LKILGLDSKTFDQPEISTVSSAHQEIPSVKFSAQTNMFLIHFFTFKQEHIFQIIFFEKVPIFKPRFLSYGKSDRAELGTGNLNFSRAFSMIFFNFF
jgi:hypothetical protein